MQRVAIFAYGILAYLLFNAVFGYMAAFLLELFVPKGINDAGIHQTANLTGAVLLNLALIFQFGFLHSLLARDHVKSWLERFLPKAAERSTYVVQASLSLALVMLFWQPLPFVIWAVDGWAAGLAYAGFALGVGIVLWSTFLIDHFELFGLRQIWCHLRGTDVPAPTFRTPALYRIVRHPMQLGVVILLVSTPVMTTGHLLFAASMIAYIFVGLYFEERSLLRTFGARYSAYQESVPMLIPGLRLGAARRAT